ncbi:MAG: DUF6788 family protein [Oligoflexales bacterium]
MKARKTKLEINGPLINGSVTKTRTKCGKDNCSCRVSKKDLHATGYRWTGKIKGKRTTVSLSRDDAAKCQVMIDNYDTLMKAVTLLIESGFVLAGLTSKK